MGGWRRTRVIKYFCLLTFSIISLRPKVEVSSYSWIPPYYHHRCAYVQTPSASWLSQMFPGRSYDTHRCLLVRPLARTRAISSHHFLTGNEYLPAWPSSTFFSFLTMAAKRGSEWPPPISMQGSAQQGAPTPQSPARSANSLPYRPHPVTSPSLCTDYSSGALPWIETLLPHRPNFVDVEHP